MARLPKLNSEAARAYAALQEMSIRAHLAGGIPLSSLPKSELQILKSVESAGYEQSPAAMLNKIEVNHERGLLQYPGVPLDPAESGLIPKHVKNDVSQDEALNGLSQVQYGALIGAAGTGKTTIIKQLIARLIYGLDGTEQYGLRKLTGRQGLSIAIVTYTGTASSVVRESLPEWCAPMAMTIHSLLEYAPVSEGSSMFEPQRNFKNKLDYDVILVDEAGQLGTNLWHNMVDALQPWTRVYLIGDINQLPPIADSPFFPRVLANALTDDPVWTLFELTKVHRQVGLGGNRVLETAHSILAGRVPEFDIGYPDNMGEPGVPWFVAGIKLPPKAEDAHKTIASFMNNFRKSKTLDENREPEERSIYMPYEDLFLTTGNGADPNSKGAALQQIPLNATMSSLLIADGDNSTHIIDAGRVTREFAVGDRIMCTQNESPDTKDRVTNGTFGVVTGIEWNPGWTGDRMKFGTRAEVLRYQAKKLDSLLGRNVPEQKEESVLDDIGDDEFQLAMDSVANINTDDLSAKVQYDKVSSHIVRVKYKTGAERTYSSALHLENLQLAYAATTAKAQGGQADTVFIVCHSACSFQLNREWLYTGATRARRRLVIFYNELGLKTALAKQQIFGATLAEKVSRYEKTAIARDKVVRLCP